MKKGKEKHRTIRLTEKRTRIPETRTGRWQEAISIYLENIKKLNSESARSHRFAMLLQEILHLEPNFIENYVSGIEKYIKARNKDRILRGETDNLFGNIIIEFEADIVRMRTEAEDQLCRYIAILWSRERINDRKPYLCIATDGERFITYSPLVIDSKAKEFEPEDVKLKVLEDANWHKLETNEIFFWLDRNFLRKQILHPTSEMIVNDFGIKSHAFQVSSKALLDLWEKVKKQSHFAVIYDNWDKYLRIVYGSKVAGDQLFISHTYLATLAKLMAWMRITGSSSLPDNDQIREILEGQFFKSQGIENFIEEDLFSWVARHETQKAGVSAVRWLYSLLQNYNLRELSEDVLKFLYQELVDPETRHDLGEFYTPDWLADKIVIRLLESNHAAKVLDPACGSGTFLYFSIKAKRLWMGDKAAVLTEVLDQVCGMDIHPLAVIIAKTNYILALGDLIKKRKSAISIPVYLADSIKLAERWAPNDEADYTFKIDSRHVFVSDRMLEDAGLYDLGIELAKEFAWQTRKGQFSEELFISFIKAQGFPKYKDDIISKGLYKISKLLKEFIDMDRDTIWAFILKNIYKPLFLRNKFDVVIGNPPWIAFRYMDPEYQSFLKQQIIDAYNLLIGHAELITQMEIATLFFLRCSDLYLRPGGFTGFVLPRSIFSADQHERFRERLFKLSADSDYNLLWMELWDCENINPLFKVPSCVLFSKKEKKAEKAKTIPLLILKGELLRKNENSSEVDKLITTERGNLSIHKTGERSYWSLGKAKKSIGVSYYKSQFANGATIYPRPFWFVKICQSPVGINPNFPLLETSDRAIDQAKNAYKGLSFRDNVEADFIYSTLLSTDILPFGHLPYRMVILPIKRIEDHYRIIDADQARQAGYVGLSKWLKIVQEEWQARRGAKAAKMNAIEWLNYRRKLVIQNPATKYRVLYNVSGTHLTSCIVDDENAIFRSNGQEIVSNGFIADYKTYYYQTSNRQEAFFISAVLNSPIIDRKIKPMQTRGLWGPRDICKKVLDLPIPRYDRSNTLHTGLAKLAEKCTVMVSRWRETGGGGKIKSIGKLRGMVRQLLKEDLNHIDNIVKKLIT